MSSFLFHSVSSKHPSGENKHSFGSGDEGGIDGKEDYMYELIFFERYIYLIIYHLYVQDGYLLYLTYMIHLYSFLNKKFVQ